MIWGTWWSLLLYLWFSWSVLQSETCCGYHPVSPRVKIPNFPCAVHHSLFCSVNNLSHNVILKTWETRIFRKLVAECDTKWIAKSPLAGNVQCHLIFFFDNVTDFYVSAKHVHNFSKFCWCVKDFFSLKDSSPYLSFHLMAYSINGTVSMRSSKIT